MKNSNLNRLKDSQVRALHSAAEKGEEVKSPSDGGGLNFINGKYWHLIYYFNGKRKKLTLGVYPTVTLKMARERREEARRLVEQGIDPAEKKKADKAEAMREAQERMTFRVVALEYFNRKLKDKKEAYKTLTLSRLENQIFPFLGEIPMAKLKPSHILAGLHAKEDEGAIDMAHRLASIIRQICKYASACGYAEYNAAADITGAMTPRGKSKPRAAITDPKEIGVLLRDIEEYKGHSSTINALRMIPYVFVRSQELRNARWGEFDLEKALWVIPAERMKMKAAHVVPLAGQVMKLLKEIKAAQEKDGRYHAEAFLFPSSKSKTKGISDMTLLNAIRNMGYPQDKMCVHGFRAMASTIMNASLLYPEEVIEAALAHSKRNKVKAAYDRADYLADRKTLMQDYADYLDSLRQGEVHTMREWKKAR
ncbi:tyrosine-type recombinase/integrase [Mailhella sp.]|uniref:tyrosine-type recombinase/integrase n=1 Tax=Mailhella sp. TaxID=1981029 RepID=UPI004064A304